MHRQPLKILLITLAAFLVAFVYEKLPTTLSAGFLALLAWILLYITAARHARLTELERVVTFKNHTLDTLLKVGSIFWNIEEAEGHYEFILTAAIEVIPNGHKGSFLILNPLNNRFEFKACHGYDLDGLKTVSFLLEETFLYKNANGHIDKPVVVKDIRHHDSKFLDPTVNANIERAGGMNVKEALSAPILIDGKIIGILNIDSERSNAFDALDEQLIHFFAKQIGMALKQKELVDETLHFNRYDRLTGAVNRDYFEKIFTAQRHRTLENLESYALALCDLNNLKVVNDTYGHAAGDQLLVAFSDRVINTLGDTDVFSRIGGDEFVILFRNKSEAAAQLKMDQLYQTVNGSPVQYHQHQIPISFSYGLAFSPEDSMIYDVLVKIADERMYAFKEAVKKSTL